MNKYAKSRKGVIANKGKFRQIDNLDTQFYRQKDGLRKNDYLT